MAEKHAPVLPPRHVLIQPPPMKRAPHKRPGPTQLDALRIMERNGWLTPAKLETALNSLLRLNSRLADGGSAAADGRAPAGGEGCRATVRSAVAAIVERYAAPHKRVRTVVASLIDPASATYTRAGHTLHALGYTDGLTPIDVTFAKRLEANQVEDAKAARDGTDGVGTGGETERRSARREAGQEIPNVSSRELAAVASMRGRVSVSASAEGRTI